MRALRTALAFCLAGLAPVACSPTAPEEEPLEHPPDVEGAWLLTVSEMQPSQGPGNAGSCQVEPFAVELWKVGEREWGGRHGNISMICAGATAPATEVFGMLDSVVLADAGPVTGSVTEQFCMGRLFTPGTSCSWPFGAALTDGFGISEFMRNSQAQLEQGVLYWSDGGEAGATGAWTAKRCIRLTVVCPGIEP